MHSKVIYAKGFMNSRGIYPKWFMHCTGICAKGIILRDLWGRIPKGFKRQTNRKVEGSSQHTTLFYIVIFLCNMIYYTFLYGILRYIITYFVIVYYNVVSWIILAPWTVAVLTRGIYWLFCDIVVSLLSRHPPPASRDFMSIWLSIYLWYMTICRFVNIQYICM